mgnify:CR=1 FL=1
MEEFRSVDQNFLKRLKLVIKAYDEEEELLSNIWKLTRIRDIKLKQNPPHQEYLTPDEFCDHNVKNTQQD